MKFTELNPSEHEKIFRALIVVCALLFLGLCLLHFFSQRPLWNDEKAVFDSIPALSFSEIFGPLVGYQVFPRVQLVLIKWFASFFQNNLLSLRFFSLLSMLIAFGVWVKIYRKSFKEPCWSILAILSFVSAYQMSYYAAELKPYAMDVLTVGLFLLFFDFQKDFAARKPTHALYAFSIALPFLVFLSYGGIFVVGIVAFNYLLLIRKNRSLITVFIINLFITIICVVVLYLTDLRFGGSGPGINDYWKDYFFSNRPGFFKFELLGEGIFEMTRWWFGENKFYWQMASPLIPLFVYALTRYGFLKWRKDGFLVKDPGSLMSVLFLELMVFSFLKKYPFTGDRMTLFLAPLVFYLIVRAIESLQKIRFLCYIYIIFYIAFLGVCMSFGFSHYMLLYGIKV